MINAINCTYTDATLRIATKGTVKAGTVLGEITAANVLAPYKSDATDGTKIPCYILVNDVENTTEESLDVENVRVIAYGQVDGDALVFAKSGDTVDVIKTTLKNNGILVMNVQKGIGD